MADTPTRGSRRQLTDELKASAVRLVLDAGKTFGAAARDLDLTETALREWVRRAQADGTKSRAGLTLAEREEFARLQKEVRELRTEREILKVHSYTGRTNLIPAGNGGQGATASLASTATAALWNLQLAESKGGGRVRIPLSPPPTSG